MLRCRKTGHVALDQRAELRFLHSANHEEREVARIAEAIGVHRTQFLHACEPGDLRLHGCEAGIAPRKDLVQLVVDGRLPPLVLRHARPDRECRAVQFRCCELQIQRLEECFEITGRTREVDPLVGVADVDLE